MQQRKRRERTDEMGYYTYWDHNKENGCIYCGRHATTREHVPSKTLLLEPYSDNLPTIPACFECNNGFSEDEEYFVCYLEILKSNIYTGWEISDRTKNILAQKPQLESLIYSQIKLIDGKVSFNIDRKRLLRIINKLATCHVGYEFDVVDFDGPIQTEFNFAFNLSTEYREKFESPQVMTAIPEISSRFSCNFYVAENIETGEKILLNDWFEVQENRYKYHVYLNEQGGVSVKIVILDYLYCQVDFN